MKRLLTSSIVFHHSASRDVSIDEVRAWHIARGFSDIGYHAIVHRDGRLEEGRRITLIGAHAKGRNWCSIGVCLMGNLNKVFPTAAQIRAAENYYVYACEYYKKKLIPSFHHAECPGSNLNREKFKSLMEAAYASQNRR